MSMSNTLFYDSFSSTSSFSGFALSSTGFSSSSSTPMPNQSTSASAAAALCNQETIAPTIPSNTLFRRSSTGNSLTFFREDSANDLPTSLEQFSPAALVPQDADNNSTNENGINDTFGSQSISYSLSTSSSASSPSSPFTASPPNELTESHTPIHSPHTQSNVQTDSNESVSYASSNESVKKKKKRYPWKGRLASQRSYDARRRVQFRSLYEELRDTLRSAEVISDAAQKWIKADVEEENIAKQGEIYNENKKKGRKKEKKSVYEKKAEQCSTIDLIYVASNLIRQLNGTKETLEKKLSTLTISEKNAQDALLKEQEDAKRKRASELLVAAAESNEDIPSAKRARIQESSSIEEDQLVLRSADAKDLNEIESLLHSIALVTKRYSEDIAIVRARESALPRFIHQLQQYFPCFTLVGMDARILMSNAMREWKKSQILRGLSQLCKDDVCKFMDNKHFRKWMHKLFRAPHMIQLHALSTLLTQGFHYQAEDTTTMEWVEELLQSDDPDTLEPQQTAQIFQYILHTLPNTNNNASSTYPLLTGAANVKAEPKPSPSHSQPSESTSTATSSSPSTASPSSGGGSAASAAPGSSPPSEAIVNKTHPLSQFALPAYSFQLLFQTLSNFVALGEKEFERVLTQLSPIAYSSFPFDYPSSIPLPFLRLPEDANRPCSAREFCFSRMNRLTYEDVCNFHALYAGEKSMVRLRSKRMMVNGYIRGIETDVSVIRDENTGLPMAHLSFPRKIFIINPNGALEKEEKMG